MDLVSIECRALRLSKRSLLNMRHGLMPFTTAPITLMKVASVENPSLNLYSKLPKSLGFHLSFLMLLGIWDKIYKQAQPRAVGQH